MLAYQMIYTGCGRNKLGSYSVWAKSANVTKAECNEIFELMSYIAPDDSPQRPTIEQIQTCFPKKYGFFVLSSGKKCIAKTTFVNEFYSDDEFRSGNFLIHAFLIDDLVEFNPFSIIDGDYFKTHLTYKEWHDDPVPEDLPAVELKAKLFLNEDTIKKYILGNQKSEIGSFLQSIIDNITSNDPIIFNDTEKNMAEIYSLIGTLLPLEICKKITFCNQTTTELDFTISKYGTQPIKLRNILINQLNNNSFNYSEKLAAGNLVFNFEKGICAYVKPKRYISDIIQSFEQGCTLFNVLTKIDKVNNIIKDTDCDVDTAIAVYYIMQNNLAWFSGVEEYQKAYDIAIKYHYINEETLATRLYNDIILTGKWGRGQDILPLVKFAYNFNGQVVKESIMDCYFNELKNYGVNLSAAPKDVLIQVKEKAPFHWDDFAANVNNPKWERYVERINSISELYFVFDAVVLAITKGFGNNYKLLVKIIKKSIERQAYDEVQLYFECAKKLSANVFSSIIEESLHEYLNNVVKNEATLDFIFHVICTLECEQEKLKLLIQFISNNMQSTFFMQSYIKCAKQYQSLFTNFEESNKNDEIFSDFFIKKDAYVFKNITNVTYRALEDYFYKYYQTGYDSGVYLEKIKQYLSAQTGKDKIEQSLKIYNLVKQLDDSFADVLSIIEYVSKEIFSLPMKELLDFTSKHMNSIVELNYRLLATRRVVPEKYNTMRTIQLFRGKLGEAKLQNCVQNNTLYNWLNSNQLVMFIDNYFNESLDCYCRYKKKKYFKNGTLLISLFEKPLALSRNSKHSIIQALEELGNNEYYELMADIMAYAFNVNDRFASTLMLFTQYYIESMKRKDYKKLFKKVIKNMNKEDIPAVQKYISKFLDEHKSFIEKLFSKKK